MQVEAMDTGRLLARKEALGRAASYRKLAERTNYAHSLIFRLLSGIPVSFPGVTVDETEMYHAVDRALDQIEREAKEPSS
jgi:hypothetical protein